MPLKTAVESLKAFTKADTAGNDKSPIQTAKDEVLNQTLKQAFMYFDGKPQLILF